MKQVFFIILFVFFVAEVSFSEVFKWVDEKGVVCFTDDISQIPEKYRPKAEKVELSEGKNIGREEWKNGEKN